MGDANPAVGGVYRLAARTARAGDGEAQIPLADLYVHLLRPAHPSPRRRAAAATAWSVAGARDAVFSAAGAPPPPELASRGRPHPRRGCRALPSPPAPCAARRRFRRAASGRCTPSTAWRGCWTRLPAPTTYRAAPRGGGQAGRGSRRTRSWRARPRLIANPRDGPSAAPTAPPPPRPHPRLLPPP